MEDDYDVFGFILKDFSQNAIKLMAERGWEMGEVSWWRSRWQLNLVAGGSALYIFSKMLNLLTCLRSHNSNALR